MDGTRHGSGKLRATMAEAAEILGVSVEAAEMIATLHEQVQAERRAHAETRRLLAAAALERIPPQLVPPSERSDSPVSADSPGPRDISSDPSAGAQDAAERRSWWRQVFGG